MCLFLNPICTFSSSSPPTTANNLVRRFPPDPNPPWTLQKSQNCKLPLRLTGLVSSSCGRDNRSLPIKFFTLFLGGKGTVRRKIVRKTKPSAAQDDKKLQGALKKLNVQPISGVEEVNMFREDGNVLHVTAPKGEVILLRPVRHVYLFRSPKPLGSLVD
jgi:hypothetical protein